MTRTTREIEQEKNEKVFWMTFFLVLFIAIVIMVFYVQLTLDKRLENVPHRFCHNETKTIEEPRYEEVECSCWKTTKCLMWCGNLTGYNKVNKTEEVCEIR